MSSKNDRNSNNKIGNNNDHHHHHHCGKKQKVIFLHLDLGIGGAEQLIVQLASATQELGSYELHLVTTRFDPNHCFDVVQPPHGKLSSTVKVYQLFPATILGMGRSICSTLRLLYASWRIGHDFQDIDILVVDVLPTSLPLLCTLMPFAKILFYCHFPDKLLVQQQQLQQQSMSIRNSYRSFVNALESFTMTFADMIVVNSKFTKSIVQQEFPHVSQQYEFQVLYPAFEQADDNDNDKNINESKQGPKHKDKYSPVVSLNRYERKKNIDLLLRSYAILVQQCNDNKENLPKCIIAGGYDTQNVENVEYYGELKQLIQSLNLQDHVEMRRNISDSERSELFHTALCVVYTPTNEHFGIVPLEAMWSYTPVVAVNSGGPTETVIDKQTGYLCEPSPHAFANAIETLIKDPKLATTMGMKGHDHANEKFSTLRLKREWKELLVQTKQSKRPQAHSATIWTIRSFIYSMEALAVFIIVWSLTIALKQMGVLSSNQSLWRALTFRGGNDEL